MTFFLYFSDNILQIDITTNYIYQLPFSHQLRDADWRYFIVSPITPKPNDTMLPYF